MKFWWPFRKSKKVAPLLWGKARVQYVGPQDAFKGKEGVLTGNTSKGAEEEDYWEVLFDSPVEWSGRKSRTWYAIIRELLVIVPAVPSSESYKMKCWLEE